jgi:hypothetical protein
MKTGPRRGVTVARARRLILALPGIEEGRSYGLPSFLLAGRFFARFRDDDTVLVVQLGDISDRDVLMQLDPAVFFFTEHYRDYPAVLIRLAQVPVPLLKDVLHEAHQAVAAQRRRRPPRPKRRRPATR